MRRGVLQFDMRSVDGAGREACAKSDAEGGIADNDTGSDIADNKASDLGKAWAESDVTNEEVAGDRRGLRQHQERLEDQGEEDQGTAQGRGHRHRAEGG